MTTHTTFLHTPHYRSSQRAVFCLASRSHSSSIGRMAGSFYPVPQNKVCKTIVAGVAGPSCKAPIKGNVDLAGALGWGGCVKATLRMLSGQSGRTTVRTGLRYVEVIVAC